MNNKIETIISELSENNEEEQKMKIPLEVLEKINPEITANTDFKENLKNRIITMVEYKRPNFLKSHFGILKIFSGSIAFCFSIFFIYLLFGNNSFNKPVLDSVIDPSIKVENTMRNTNLEEKNPIGIIFDEKTILEKQKFSEELEKVNKQADRENKTIEKNEEKYIDENIDKNEKIQKINFQKENELQEESFLVPDEEVPSENIEQDTTSLVEPMMKSFSTDNSEITQNTENESVNQIQKEEEKISEKTFEEFMSFCNSNGGKIDGEICMYSNKSCSFSAFKLDTCK